MIDEVKAMYKKLVLTCHPDKARQSLIPISLEDAQEKFKKLNEAYKRILKSLEEKN